MFEFTQVQYDEFRTWLQYLNKYRDNAWPDKADWKTYPGMPDYELYQNQLQRDFVLTVVFTEKVKTPYVIRDAFTVSDYNKGLML